MREEGEIKIEAIRTALRLEDWNEEPEGALVQTEPDPAARERIRDRLRAKLATLKWVLKEGE